MKKRNGFVSNSSSSSFCIYGSSFDAKDILTEKELEEEDQYDLVDKKCSDLGLSMHYPDGFDTYFVGVSWKNIGEDETGKQFKARVDEAMEKLTGKKVKCETLEEAWHD